MATSPAPGAAPDGGSGAEVGLPAERTALAWVRMGLSLLAVPGGLIAYAAGRNGLALGAAAGAWVLGLFLLLTSLPGSRRAQLRAGSVDLRLATGQVVLTSAAVTLVAVAALALVLTRGP